MSSYTNVQVVVGLAGAGSGSSRPADKCARGVLAPACLCLCTITATTTTLLSF